MNTFSKYVLSAAGFAILAGAIVAVTAPYAISQVKAALVRDIDNPALQPFTMRFGSNWTGNAGSVSFFANVPAGKRLVVEQVSFRADVTPSAGQKVSAQVLTTTQSVSSAYFFLGALRGPAGVFGEFIGAAQMRSYADAGGLQEILITRSDVSGGSNDNADVSLSGYLVNVP